MRHKNSSSSSTLNTCWAQCRLRLEGSRQWGIAVDFPIEEVVFGLPTAAAVIQVGSNNVAGVKYVGGIVQRLTGRWAGHRHRHGVVARVLRPRDLGF